MRRIYLLLCAGLLAITAACTEDLLDQVPTTQLSSALFWKTTTDAVYAVNGVYDANRTTFDRDYYFDGLGEFVNTRGTSNGQGSYNPGGIGSATNGTTGGNFGFLWGDCYRAINRANYVLENIGQLRAIIKIPADLTLLDRLVAETKFVRAINYFRLIDLWGDVPYYTKTLDGNAEAYSLIRTPRAVVKDSILADLRAAATVLPDAYAGDNQGRATRLAALGFRGKINLFWASWMKKEGKSAEAQKHFTDAAADFKQIIDKNIPLFRNGEPGPADNPNYWHLFQYFNEYDPEISSPCNLVGRCWGRAKSLCAILVPATPATHNAGWPPPTGW